MIQNQTELANLPDDELLKLFGTHFHEMCDNVSADKIEEQTKDFSIVSAAILHREFPVLEICRSIMEFKKNTFTEALRPFPTNADTFLEIVTAKKKILECNG